MTAPLQDGPMSDPLWDPDYVLTPEQEAAIAAAKESQAACIAELAGLPSTAEAGPIKPRDPNPLLTCAEFAALQPSAWHIDGQYPAGGDCVVTARYSSGKSALALDQAFATATGTAWGERATVEGPVLYLVAEGRSGLAGRTRRHLAKRAMHSAAITFLPVAISFLRPETPSRILRWLHEREIAPDFRLVIQDTYSRFGGGAKEDASDDTTLRLNIGAELKERLGNPAMLYLHHPGNGGENRSRGSSALEAGADTVIRLEKPKDGSIVTVTCDKQRDGALFAPFTFRLDGPEIVEIEPPIDPSQWTAASRRTLSTGERGALQRLDDASRDPEYSTDGMPSGKWETACGLEGSNMDRARRRLFELGYVRQMKKVGNSNRYVITPEGANALLPR